MARLKLTEVGAATPVPDPLYLGANPHCLVSESRTDDGRLEPPTFRMAQYLYLDATFTCSILEVWVHVPTVWLSCSPEFQPQPISDSVSCLTFHTE